MRIKYESSGRKGRQIKVESETNSTSTVCRTIAKQVREEVVNKYGDEVNLCGHCIEASDRIVELLSAKGITARTIEGWCLYDDECYGSDMPYDAHTWVELNDGTYIDVTADQFNPGMYRGNELPGIIVGQKPSCMVYVEPDDVW